MLEVLIVTGAFVLEPVSVTPERSIKPPDKEPLPVLFVLLANVIVVVVSPVIFEPVVGLVEFAPAVKFAPAINVKLPALPVVEEVSSFPPLPMILPLATMARSAPRVGAIVPSIVILPPEPLVPVL